MKWSSLFKRQEASVLLGLIFLIVIFSSMSPHFMTLSTWGGIFTVTTETGLIALGATLLMICGEFDLSVGSTFALSGMFFATLTAQWGWNSYLSFFLSLLLGSGVGLINGLITLKMRIPSFITTLGSMLFWRGVVLIATEGFPISSLGPLAEKFSVMNLWGSDLGNGFRSSVFLLLILGLYYYYILNHHPFGSWVMATGGHREASYSMGVRTFKVKLLCFINSGFLAALAGVIQFAHMESISPTAGEQYELRAMAIAVIGGTQLTGGSGTMIGTLIGALLMGVLSSGLVQVGISSYWFRSFLGVILILAVIFNLGLQRRFAFAQGAK